MNKVLVEESSLSGIATAIRAKNGSANVYKPGEMAAAIQNLPSASTLGTKSISGNGNYSASADNLDGYSSVSVDVPNSYSQSDEGKIVHNGELVALSLQSKTTTSNGTVTPDSGYDGLSSVVVNVQTGVNLPVSLTVTPPTQTQYTEGDTLDLTGIAVTAVYADGTTEDVTSECTFSPADGSTLGTVGTQTITASWTGTGTVTGGSYSVALTGTTSVTVEAAGPEIVSWASGTDAQIAAMVAALDAGTLSIAETGWQIGDERTVSLAAMSATGVGESHAAQNVTMVLMDSQHFDLVEATAGGDTKDHFVVGMKDCLNADGYMNSSRTNSGSWDGCNRRTWCNEVFRAAIPATLRSCFKQFKCITAETYNGSTTKVSNDYFALFAEQEVFGARENSNATEAAALTQIAWYKTAANRKKKVGSYDTSWWERSPKYDQSVEFVITSSTGGHMGNTATMSYSISPFGCI